MLDRSARQGRSHLKPARRIAGWQRNVIEIPGYRILRQLGRGGMATVYLATQESVQRDVALKVMSPSLLTDPDFSERFLREARIAAKLHHRHVVGVHDVGRHGDYNYMAMEYLSGGPIIVTEGGARLSGFSLRVTREIAQALHYAHAKGFVHRDVKPDNVLLRDDTSSALTDFGIARASDSATRMTRTGAVIGTPHYMSPEQARGRTIDGRSDLYSLGIVLYELLMGRVPYHADDSLAVGIMHITQPIPVLPEHMQPLQPLLNRLLAKQPEDRYQTGQQLADAIEQIEIAIAQGDLPMLDNAEESYRREVPGATPAPRDRLTTPTAAVRGRSEPSMGRIDDAVAASSQWRLHTQSSRNSRARAERPRRWMFPIVALLILAAGGFAAWRYQDRLRALIPNTELNSVITRADKALADGKLVGTQHDSARELYDVARTLEPDNEAARNGLRKVGERLIEQARIALTRNDFTAVKSNLASAEEVLGGGAEIEQLKSALQQAQTRNSSTDELLRRGDAALSTGRLLGENSASAWYQKVLDADATNALALNGLKKVAEAQALQARDAINASNATLANQRIAELATLAPNHPAIPELRADVAKMKETDNQALDQSLVKAEAQLKVGKLGGDDGAIALFQTALKREPTNARAKNGLRRISQGLVAQANTALEDKNVALAERLLQQAETITADLPESRATRSHLREVREQQDIASKHSDLSPSDEARIDQLLGEADKALATGNLIIPPGDSAYDKFRAVLRIDGNNPKAFDGLNRIPARAKDLFEQSIKEGTPNKARSYIDAIANVDPGNSNVLTMRERLANVFLDQAESRAGQNMRAEAMRAINAARELSPNNSRLPAIEQKVQALQAPAPAASGGG
jgi:serine/threonine-protein kinase PpkA